MARFAPRQRKFHGGAPGERKIAPIPSAVIVGSTPGARWKRMAYGTASRILRRPFGVIWSAPRSSFPSLPSIRLRLWTSPKPRT